MKRLLPALLLSAALHAQTASLVKDINSTTAASPASSYPAQFLRYGSGVYFAAMRSASGSELWVTDGTAAGTSMVTTPPTGGASNPSALRVVNGTLVFTGRNRLWMSDGTPAGTRLMADIIVSNGETNDRIVHRGRMLFAGRESTYGTELWITDGTPAGTRSLKDLTPGPNGSEPHAFVMLSDTVYFIAGDAIWKTDGTAEGTVPVKAVFASGLFVAGSRIFFTGWTQAAGNELWVSDGTEAGTRLLADLAPGTRSSYPGAMTLFGDGILFSANDEQHGTELWFSDGTAAGTRLVRDIQPGALGGSPSFPTVLNGVAYFGAYSAATGRELWRTDGTEAGTQLVRDLNPGNTHSSPEGLLTVGDRIFFVAHNGERQTLWVSDGSAAGTRVANPEVAANAPLANVDGTVYFAGANRLNGLEPWKSDGTAAGTVMVANVANDAAPSSRPEQLTAAGDWVYFRAWDGLRPPGNTSVPHTLWRSDGTPEGTLEVLGSYPSGTFHAVGRSLLFGEGQRWLSDGTPSGTRRALELEGRFPQPPGVAGVVGETIFLASGEKLYATKLAAGSPVVLLSEQAGSRFVESAGKAFFFSQNFNISALRVTDGTYAGTHSIKSLPGQVQSPAVMMGGQLYFAVWNSGYTLWKSDGTHEGTVTIPAPAGTLADLTPAGRLLFFTANEQLAVTDGRTDARLLGVKATQGPVAVGDRVVFSATDTASGPELWVSDGTAEGTKLLRDINPGTPGSTPQHMAEAGGLVYFSAFSSGVGTELWVTDGTPEGTRLAADLDPGSNSSFPQELVRTGERLFFRATTAALGTELWALPLAGPRLAVRDVRVPEGTAARFTVSLSQAAAAPVTVEWATADGTAAAGSDYDAASGTLTFAAGETSKSITVIVRGDAAIEGNETFAVVLRNPSGAALERASAFASIEEDEDRTVDLSVSHDFSFIGGLSTFVNVANRGAVTATEIRRVATATPADVAASTCASCPGTPAELDPGQSARAFEYRWSGMQQYLTFALSSHERDSNPADNAIGWTTHNFMALDALYLTPGGQGNVWLDPFGDVSSVSVESSNPAVVSVPATVSVPSPQAFSFPVRAGSVGTATIRVFTPTVTVGTLQVDVVAPGTTPRWPGAINVFLDQASLRLDQQASLRIYTVGTAPFSGRPATGVVTVSANGVQTGRTVLDTATRTYVVPYSLADAGPNTITVSYAGDANFLPVTRTFQVTATRGNVTVTASAHREGTSLRLRVRVSGSPVVPPTGTVTVGDAQATLTGGEAELLLPNLPPGGHTFTIAYSGDSRYAPATQQVRHIDRRRPSRP
ncbi:MAG TPA: ELWxxDGT repeat protein [Thermoanaerobaculia bacterium]|nr:ELWxxDGT repeat protein [Thermoanaerobaculia bacterium]